MCNLCRYYITSMNFNGQAICPDHYDENAHIRITTVCLIANITYTNKTLFQNHKWSGKRVTAVLFILLGTQASIGICNTNGKLLGTLNYLLAFSAWNIVSNLGWECPVLHQENLQFLQVNHTSPHCTAKQHKYTTNTWVPVQDSQMHKIGSCAKWQRHFSLSVQ